MRCCVVRHGETDWNAEKRLQGHQDIPLNALGVQQAQAAAIYLQQQGAAFTALHSSDLLRARQTAEALAATLQLTLQPSRLLRERYYGDFEGKTPAEAAAMSAQEYAALISRESLTATPGHAESLQTMLQRVETCLYDLVQQYPDDSVIVVTHGGVLDLLYRRATGRPLTGPRDASIPNAGLNWLDIKVTQTGTMDWHLRAWGITEHLVGTSLDEIL